MGTWIVGIKTDLFGGTIKLNNTFSMLVRNIYKSSVIISDILIGYWLVGYDYNESAGSFISKQYLRGLVR